MDKTGKFLIHDLSNKLQILTSKVEIAQSKLIKAGEDSFLINQTFEGLARTLEDVNEICRSSSLINNTEGEVSLSAILSKSIDDYNSVKEIVFVFNQHFDPVLKVNGCLLNRVIDNLFKNSIEAGCSKITIELYENTLRIKDNGSGMSLEQFKEFKLGKFYSSKNINRGLGLEFISEFCKRYDCALNYNSTNDSNIDSGFEVEINFERLLSV